MHERITKQSQRIQYENLQVEQEILRDRITDLEKERDNEQALHDEVHDLQRTEEGDPDARYVYFEEREGMLHGYNESISTLKVKVEELNRKLKKFHAEAWDEAIAENTRIDLQRTILPEVRKECTYLRDLWSRVERRGRDIIARVDEIPKELEELLTHDSFSLADSQKIIALIQEFFELKQKIFEIHATSFAPNLKNKEL